jgi:hypothetical protein
MNFFADSGFWNTRVILFVLFVPVRDHKLSAGTGRTHQKSLILMILIPDRGGPF